MTLTRQAEDAPWQELFTAYNFAKHLKALRWKTPFQTICQAWIKDPDRFRINPHHLIPGPYTEMRTPVFALIFAAATVAASAVSAGSYAVSTGVKGVVALYDLSSVMRTERGFTIANVAVSDHFPTIFGPVAYRVDREDYDCGTGHYVIAKVREYDRNGRLLNEVGRIPEDDMVVVAGTAGADMYDRFCEAGRRGVSVTGLAPEETVELDTPFAAYRYGRTLLPQGVP